MAPIMKCHGNGGPARMLGVWSVEHAHEKSILSIYRQLGRRIASLGLIPGIESGPYPVSRPMYTPIL